MASRIMSDHPRQADESRIFLRQATGIAPDLGIRFLGAGHNAFAGNESKIWRYSHLVAHLYLVAHLVFGKRNDTFAGRPGLLQTLEYRFRLLAG